MSPPCPLAQLKNDVQFVEQGFANRPVLVLQKVATGMGHCCCWINERTRMPEAIIKQEQIERAKAIRKNPRVIMTVPVMKR